MKSLESSWSAINEEAEATEVVNNRPAGGLLVVDIFTLMAIDGKLVMVIISDYVT